MADTVMLEVLLLCKKKNNCKIVVKIVNNSK